MIEVDAASPDLVTNASTQNFAATLVLFEDVGNKRFPKMLEVGCSFSLGSYLK